MKSGDVIKFLNEEGGGIVLRVEGDRVCVEDDHGFEHWYPLSEVILEKNEHLDWETSIHQAKEEKERKIDASKKHRKNHQERWFVDLHLHELIDNDRGLTNFQKLRIQLNQAEKKLQQARKNKVRFLVIIHGKGTGKLRSEIRKWLSKQDVMSYYDGDYDQQYPGTTEVQLY